MFKKLSTMLLIMAMAVSVFASTALAKSDHARHKLVALGDSISYGYNLGANNDQPSDYAFPYLMQEDAKLKVANWSVPGMTSTQLLSALQSDSQYRKDVKHADYVTLEIGNNDLLQAVAAAKNADGSLNIPLLQQNLATTVLPTMLNNLKSTLLEIRSLTDAPIAIYNIYNPYQVNNQPMHAFSDLMLTQLVNNNLAAVVQSLTGAGVADLVIADAYAAFGSNQLAYVRQNDVHPTIEGQEVLAEIGLAALGL